jgi:hypothetical protein
LKEPALFSLKQKLKQMLICFAAFCCCIPLASQEKRKIAILEPFGREPVTQMNKANVRGTLTEFIPAALDIIVVNQANIDEIVKEHGIIRVAMNIPAKARELANLLGADLALVTDLYRERDQNKRHLHDY